MTNYTIYICNAFSINMLPNSTMVEFRKFRDILEVREFLKRHPDDEIISGIGHRDMAEIISKQIGMEIPVERRTISLDVSNDMVIVAQYTGPRLPEGATTLPEGAEIRYWLCIPGMEYCTEPI